MDNTEKTNITPETPTAPTATPEPIVREFEVTVYEQAIDDRTGKEVMTPVRYDQPIVISAASRQELKDKLDVFKRCGQVAKVAREVTKPEVLLRMQQMQQNQQSTALNPAIAAPTIGTIQSTPVTIPAPIATQPQKTAPKYFKLGDVEVKEDNGKFYQKQWMRLSDKESSNIRVVNDKNNSTVNLTGKHLEMKKWVLVENDSQEDDVTAMEENLS